MTTNTIELLDVFDLRDAADVLRENSRAVSELLPDQVNTFLSSAHQLLELAALKDAADEEKARIEAEKLAAVAAEKARHEAAVQALMADLTTVGSKRKSAVKLLEHFDITPKA